VSNTAPGRGGGQVSGPAGEFSATSGMSLYWDHFLRDRNVPWGGGRKGYNKLAKKRGGGGPGEEWEEVKTKRSSSDRMEVLIDVA